MFILGETKVLFMKEKELSRDCVEYIATQLLYEAVIRKSSASYISWRLSQLLSECGIKTEYIPLPRPDK